MGGPSVGLALGNKEITAEAKRWEVECLKLSKLAIDTIVSYLKRGAKSLVIRLICSSRMIVRFNFIFW